MSYACATMSDCSAIARSAIARTHASFISSLIVVAPTSSAPRKMNGKQRTLLTWFGKSERPVAMTASGRACLRDVRHDLGLGIGEREDQRRFAPSVASHSGFSTRAADSPRKTSAPGRISASVRAVVSCA